jgi:hypothetical protein
MKKIFGVVVFFIITSLAKSQPLANNIYNVSKQFDNTQINGFLYLGSISNTGYGTFGKITATAHYCGQLFIAEFDFYGTYYAGSFTDWIEVPIARGNDWNSQQNFALDVRLANHGAPFEIRLRRLSGSGSNCSGGTVYIKIETNGVYTENVFEGFAASMTNGYLGKSSGWQFPVMQDRFANTESGMFIKNDGNIGIGTNSPSSKLNVFQGAGDNNIGSAAIRVGGTGNYPSLEFGIKGAYDGMISTYGNDLHIYAGNWRSNGATASENHNISFYTSQAGSPNWNTPKLILNHFGNLGIGTTNPSKNLSLVGTFSLESEAANSPYSKMYLSYTGYNAANPNLIITPSTTPGSGIVQSSLFLKNSNGNSTLSNNTMNLLIEGKVSIGTSDLTEKLSVNGNIRAKKLIVSQQNWSDYVFYKGYKLRPLNELEKFIQKHQHLPDVPSTKEVQSKGINVGDTQAILMKKIEELTLYIIELSKKVQLQELLNKEQNIIINQLSKNKVDEN